MSKRNVIWSLIVVLFIGVIAFNMRTQFKSAQNLQKEQLIEDAFIKFTAPVLERKTVNEKKVADSLGDSAEKVSVYGVFVKKAEYSVFYIKYKEDFDFQQHSDIFIKLFDDYHFEPEIIKSENKITLAGNYTTKDGQTSGIRTAFIKKGINLWQVFAIYPYSKENEISAKNFIDSIEIDPLNKL